VDEVGDLQRLVLGSGLGDETGDYEDNTLQIYKSKAFTSFELNHQQSHTA
jgi:hypothetical protein